MSVTSWTAAFGGAFCAQMETVKRKHEQKTRAVTLKGFIKNLLASVVMISRVSRVLRQVRGRSQQSSGLIGKAACRILRKQFFDNSFNVNPGGVEEGNSRVLVAH